jgi:hypothetical protein
MPLKKEHYDVFLAINMWLSTLLELCDENMNTSHAFEYNYFVVNGTNYTQNPNGEIDIKQAIDDFYDYFYINQHICDINYMRTLGEIDNNYGIGKDKLRLLDILKKIENNDKFKSLFKRITIYVFQLCCSVRKTLGLKIFEDTEKDTSIVKYFTRHP